MTGKTPAPTEQIRTAEVISAACLATDLGMGFPFEHGLHATLITMRLCDLLEVDSETASLTYYACLLMYSGCTTDADLASRIFGSSMTENVRPVEHGSRAETLKGVIRALPPPGTPVVRRPYEIARRLPLAAKFRGPHYAALCEVAAMLAERLGLPKPVADLFTHLTEQWDGGGVLGRAEGDEIPLPLRIVQVARDAAFQRVIGGDEHAIETIHQRSGHAFDPVVATLFADHAPDILAEADAVESAWEAALAAEPRPWLSLQGQGIDRALAALGDFADLVSPWLSGHSQGVAELARTAATIAGFDHGDVASVGRAAHIHDLGRVAVHPRIWQSTSRLSADEWEQVRLHGYHTERIFSRSPLLAGLARIGCAHHERLDGSGYHRGLGAAALEPMARLLAAADAFHAMTEPRPHRKSLTPEQAAERLVEGAGAGRYDPDLVAAVITAAGQAAPHIERPAGLTQREAEVIGLLARGLQTKQVAVVLGISAKTADTHIQNAYRKLNVSTRAAATLFAMEHGLVPSGELPIP